MKCYKVKQEFKTLQKTLRHSSFWSEKLAEALETAQRPLPLLSKAALGHADESCLRVGPLHVRVLCTLFAA